MKTTSSYDNAIKGRFLDGLRPDRSGNPAAQAAHLLNHYIRRATDADLDSDCTAEIAAIVQETINAAVGYSVVIAIDQVKLMLGESLPTVPALRTVTLHPQYPGAVLTKYLRGANYGSNDAKISMGQDCVSHVVHNYYEGISSEASLHNFYVSLRYTLPDDFVSWACENAIQIEFMTERGTYLNSHVSAFAYKSGKHVRVASSSHNAMTEWGAIVLADVDSEKAAWSPGDVLELYLDLASRNNYYARVGAIKFSYVGRGNIQIPDIEDILAHIGGRLLKKLKPMQIPNRRQHVDDR